MANNGNGLGFNNYAARYLAGVVNAAGTTPGVLVSYAVEALSVDLWILQAGAPVSAWPFYGGNAAAHALDLYRRHDITWQGTVTHDSNGATGDGTTGIGLTGINPAVALNPASCSMSVYSRTNSSADSRYEMGCFAGALYMYILCRNVAGNAVTGLGGPAGASMTGAVGASTGLFNVHRVSTVAAGFTRNGVSVASTTVSSSSLPYVSFLSVCGAAGLNFSARNLAFAHVGPQIGDHVAFNAAVNAYQVTLGRNV